MRRFSLARAPARDGDASDSLRLRRMGHPDMRGRALLAAACFATVLGGAAVLAGPAAAQERGSGKAVDPAPAAPKGEVLLWSVPGASADAPQRYAAYRLPANYDPAAGATLVLILHGSNLDYRWGFANFDVKSFRRNDILISCDGSAPNGSGGFNFMQDRAGFDYAIGIIERFKKSYKINRVYVFGHSQGAFFAYFLLGERPDLVDGVVGHAGNVLNVKHPPAAKSRPIAIIHDKGDQVVGFECATRTKEVYEKAAYEHVKLFATEVKNPNAGHWPNPPVTADALAWVDSCSKRGPLELVKLARDLIAGGGAGDDDSGEAAGPPWRKALVLLAEARGALGRPDVPAKARTEAKAAIADLMAKIDARVRLHGDKLQALAAAAGGEGGSAAGPDWKALKPGAWSAYAVLLRARYGGSDALAELEKKTYGAILRSQGQKGRPKAIELKKAVFQKQWAKADKAAAELVRECPLALADLDVGAEIAAVAARSDAPSFKTEDEARQKLVAEAEAAFNEVDAAIPPGS